MKAVLVMEMPDKCLNCPLHQYIDTEEGEHDAFVFCSAEHWREPITHQPVENLEERPDWCPLRLLPQKEKVNADSEGEFKTIDDAWTQGFNACLDEITGDCGDACRLRY